SEKMAFEKIKVANPVVEMDGDEMTRVLWKSIKDKLIFPFLELDIKYFDLGLPNRDATDDKVTIESVEDTLKYNVAIKCATITPDEARMREFNLKHMWKSPNGPIRNILNGTFHLYHNRATDTVIKGPGKLKLVFGANTCDVQKEKMKGQSWRFSTLLVLEAWLCPCTTLMSLRLQILLWNVEVTFYPSHLLIVDLMLIPFLKRFKHTFQEVYETNWKSKFEATGIWYEHRLIDDMIAYALTSEGGYVWTCKNCDGDMQSDFLAQGFGPLGLMTSVLMCPDGKTVEAEAAHGTVTRHYRVHQKGGETSTNSIASVFAWSRGLAHGLYWSRGVWEDDQGSCTYNPWTQGQYLNTEEFIDAVVSELRAKLGCSA
ncbi:unnamed protein product, partial [Thlaspi arvense]